MGGQDVKLPSHNDQCHKGMRQLQPCPMVQSVGVTQG